MEAVISSVISAIVTLAGTVITVIAANGKTMAEFKTAQAVTETQITELTREVRELIPDPRVDGSLEQPYPYAPGMALINGKHYAENGVVYYCNRDTGNPIYHPLAQLVGIYVQEVNKDEN